MKTLERRLQKIEGRAPPKKFRVYDIDVPWDGPITQEQQDQLIDESGIKEREDYEEEAFNIFRFYVSPIECETPSL